MGQAFWQKCRHVKKWSCSNVCDKYYQKYHEKFRSTGWLKACSLNGDRLRESKVRDTRRDPLPGRGHGDQWMNLSVTAWAPSIQVLVQFDEYLSKSVPVIPRCGQQICSVLSAWIMAWKNAGATQGYHSPELAKLNMSITGIDLVAGPGIVLWCLNWLILPWIRELLCFVSLSTFHEFPFPFSFLLSFFFFFSVAALHKHWRVLDYLTAS